MCTHLASPIGLVILAITSGLYFLLVHPHSLAFSVILPVTWGGIERERERFLPSDTKFNKLCVLATIMQENVVVVTFLEKRIRSLVERKGGRVFLLVCVGRGDMCLVQVGS